VPRAEDGAIKETYAKAGRVVVFCGKRSAPFSLSTSVIVLIGFLMFLTWRELVSEFDASLRDFASSLNY
jgi:hypothetical protein